jgi:ribokinase
MIIVFGSINMDLNVGMGNFPQPGETIISLDYTTTPGGKGANQSLAAARCGEKTALVGKVGDDGMGLRILNSLRRHEVMTSGVATAESLPTGLSIVMRERSGDYRTVLAAGANAELKADQVPDEILRPGNILLIQMETPWQQSLEVMKRAKEFGVTVVMNAAPVRKFAAEALSYADYLIVNDAEAKQLAAMLGMAAESDYARLAKAYALKTRATTIITLGDKGLVCVSPKGEAWKVAALKLDTIVETAGAGDCFCGTFAAALHAKKPLPAALKRASVAAGLSCRKAGIQEAYPYSAEVEENLSGIPEPEFLKI